MKMIKLNTILKRWMKNGVFSYINRNQPINMKRKEIIKGYQNISNR